MGDGRKLLMLLFFGSIFGLILLVLFSKSIQPQEVSVSEIDESFIGKYVKVSGIVSRVNEYKGHLFLSIYDDREIEIPIFSEKYKVLKERGFDVYIGDYVEVYGTVDTYQGRYQILLDDVESLKIYKVVYGFVDNGKIKTNNGIFNVDFFGSGFYGFVGENFGDKLIFEKIVFVEFSDSFEVGSFVELKGRVSRVREYEEGVKTELFGFSQYLWGKEKYQVSDFLHVYGIVGEMKGYVEIIPLYVSIFDVSYDSILIAKSYEDYFPVRVRGVVLSRRDTEGGFLLEIGDESGTITVLTSSYVEIGDGVEVSGILKTYQGKKEIIAENVEEVNFEIECKRIGDVLEMPPKSLVKTMGVVFSRKEFSHYMLLGIREGEEIFVYVKKKNIKIGDLVEVFGVLKLYKGTLEIEAINIEKIGEGDGRTKISEVLKYVGNTVMVQGIVEEIYISKNSHVFLTLKDESGEILVPIFKSIAEGLTIDVYSLKKGDKITVIGTVKIYNSQYEIIPIEIFLD